MLYAAKVYYRLCPLKGVTVTGQTCDASKHGTTYAFPSCAISESKIIIALIMFIFSFRFFKHT